MGAPNFLLIGVGKAGTTSVYYYLTQHPDIYMSPIKEPRFFVYDKSLAPWLADPEVAAYFPCRTIEQYEALFAGTGHEKVVGEASIQYYASPAAAERIARTLDSPKMVAILRNPIDRAYSSYTMEALAGREHRSFEQVVKDEINGVNAEHPMGRFHHLDRGLYHHHLTTFRQHMPRGDLKILLYDDLQQDSLRVMREIFKFLGVDEDFVPDTSIRYNPSGVPKHKLLHKLTDKNPVTQAAKRYMPKRIRDPLYAGIMRWRNQNLEQCHVPMQTWERLRSYYQSDVDLLQVWLGRDLSQWLAPTSMYSAA